MTRREEVEAELRDFARLQVRAGLLAPDEQFDEVRSAVSTAMPDTDSAILARAWLAAAAKDLDALALAWQQPTDHDRLVAAFDECSEHGVPVLQGVEDHWAATEHLRGSESPPRGVIWFTPVDVWHAIDAGMLEINLWHGTGANAAPGDALLDAVLSCLDRHGLRARFDEGRVEILNAWQRRP